MSDKRKTVTIKRKMPVNDLMGSFSSKSSFYSYLKEQLQYYMPPYTMITAPFLKQVLKGEKQLLMVSVQYEGEVIHQEIHGDLLY